MSSLLWLCLLLVLRSFGVFLCVKVWLLFDLCCSVFLCLCLCLLCVVVLLSWICVWSCVCVISLCCWVVLSWLCVCYLCCCALLSCIVHVVVCYDYAFCLFYVCLVYSCVLKCVAVWFVLFCFCVFVFVFTLCCCVCDFFVLLRCWFRGSVRVTCVVVLFFRVFFMSSFVMIVRFACFTFVWCIPVY